MPPTPSRPNRTYRVESLHPEGHANPVEHLQAQSPEHAARIIRERGHLATKITEVPPQARRVQLPVAGRAAPGLQVQSPQGMGYHFPVGEADAKAAEDYLKGQGHKVVGGVNLPGRTPQQPAPTPSQPRVAPVAKIGQPVTPFTLIRTKTKAGYPVTSVTHGPPDAAFERLGKRGLEYVSHRPLTVAQAAEEWRKMSDHLKRNKGEPVGGMKRFHVSVRTKAGPRTFRVTAPTAFSALGRLVDAGHTVTHVEPVRPRRLSRKSFATRKYAMLPREAWEPLYHGHDSSPNGLRIFADRFQDDDDPRHMVLRAAAREMEQTKTGGPFRHGGAHYVTQTTSDLPDGTKIGVSYWRDFTGGPIRPRIEWYSGRSAGWGGDVNESELREFFTNLARHDPEMAAMHEAHANKVITPTRPAHDFGPSQLSRRKYAARKPDAGFGRSDEKHAGNAHIFDAVAKQLGIKQYNRNWPPYGKMAVVANELDRVGRYDESSLLRDGHDPNNPLFFDGQKVVRWTPDMADIDWRPNEVIPEDYYGYSRRKYAARKPDAGHAFVSALRRLRSKQQQALHGVAKEIAGSLNLNPAVTRDALHDGPGGATPSIAQAVQGGDPATARYAAAWYGLLTRTPALGVFHVAPDGPDSAYKFTMRGSGEDVRKKLDRGGISPRVLLPRRDGWDVFVYDQGRRLRENIRAFAKVHGLKPEESVGKGETLGHADPAEARAKFRSVIMGYENKPRQMARSGNPEKYTVVIGRIPDTPDPGRRTARLASGRRAAFRAAAKAILSPDGFGHALEWGGGVANAYGYPAESQFAVATASAPDGKIVLHHGWVGARNLGVARVGNIYPEIRPLYDSRYGAAAKTRALDEIKRGHHEADWSLPVHAGTTAVGRIGIHPEVMNFLRKMSQGGKYDPNTAAILADWLQEHRGMSDHVANLIRRQSSLTDLLQVLHEHSLRPGSFAPSPALQRFDEPERMARTGRPARYSASEDDFHAAISHAPYAGHDMIYADWLEESGRPHTAEVIRHLAGQFHPSVSDGGLPNPSAGVGLDSGWVNLLLPTATGHLYWKGYVPKGRIGPLAVGMHGEGVSIDKPTLEAAKSQKLSRRSRPWRYARLGQPEPLLGTDFIHPIHDDSGNRIGHVWVTPQENGVVKVNHVGAHGNNPNTLGPAEVLNLRRQLLAAYPGSRRIAGLRVSGWKPGRQVNMSVPDRQVPGPIKSEGEARRNMSRRPSRKTFATGRIAMSRPADPYVVLYGRKGGRKSKAWISAKIRKLIEEGKPQKQAVAIALNMGGVSNKG